MILKIAIVCVFGVVTLWMCNLGMKRGARSATGAALGAVPEKPTCPKCGGPTTARDTPCSSCR